MKRVLFVAELGAGFGHVRRMLPLARAARRMGLRPTFLVPNPGEVGRWLDDGFELARAPVAPRVRRSHETTGGIARSFSDILARAGFDDESFIAAALGSWRQVVDELRPVAAVCEFSPFFCLATTGGALPVLVSGYGFVLPPPELDRFPLLWAGTPDEKLELRLLEATNAAARRHERPPLDALPALLQGTAHAVTGLALLDPYSGVRAGKAVGPLGLTEPGFDVQSERERKLFGYLLGDAPDTLPLLRALAASGLHGSVFVRRAQPAQRAVIDGSRITWLERPEPTALVLKRASVVAHHASMLLSEETITAGVPQLLQPIYLEHALTARILAATGAASIIRPGAPFDEMAAQVRAVLEQPAIYSAARELANAVRAQLPPTELAAELLGTVL